MTNVMKKIALFLTLIACLTSSLFMGLKLLPISGAVKANESETAVELGADGGSSKAGAIAISVVEALFGDDKGAISVKSVFKNIFADIGYVNAGISFLKLIGVMKDPTAEALANIQRQLEIINDKLNVMDQKLDDIIKSMSEISARQDFIARTESARDYRRYFSEFKKDYCENGLEKLINSFDAMRINAMKGWYNSETANARVGDTIDNSKVVLIYDKRDDGSYELRYSLKNGVPQDFDGRYLILSEEFLPLKNDVGAWNIDDYFTELQNYIVNKIYSGFSDIVSNDYPEYTPDGVYPDGIFTEEVAKQTAADAVNLLIYRTTAEEINKSAEFAKNVKSAFENYKSNLVKSENGFDAIIRALYYTHTFEYEISDVINDIFAELVFETVYYGSFAKDVIGMSNDISKDEKAAFNDVYCDAINTLDNIKNAALTGHPNYCYLTNTIVYYGLIDMTASAEIKTYADGPDDGYTSYTAQGFTTKIYRYNNAGTTIYGPTSAVKYNNSYLIGNDAANLIFMTLRSNGIVAGHDYFMTNIPTGSKTTNCGATLVSLSGETTLPKDSAFPMKVQKVIGDYFTDGSTVTLRNLPANLSSEYVNWNKMIQGSVFNFATGSLSANATVAGVALYGEHHWYWSDDESAFMSGTVSSVIERNYQKVCTKDYGTRRFDNNYSMATRFNCILQEPYVYKLSGSENAVDPLNSFREESGYVEFELSEETENILPSESSSLPEKEQDKAIYQAVMTIPSLYKAVIIIPCVFVGLIGAGIAVYLIVRARRIKKKK